MDEEPTVGESEDQPHRISRRTIIKRGAIIGGIAWVAPMIATTPAFAQTGSDVHACCACTGCPQGQSICNSDHTLGVGLQNQAACDSFCANSGCASSGNNYVEATHLWNCPGVGSNGTPICQPK